MSMGMEAGAAHGHINAGTADAMHALVSVLSQAIKFADQCKARAAGGWTNYHGWVADSTKAPDSSSASLLNRITTGTSLA